MSHENRSFALIPQKVIDDITTHLQNIHDLLQPYAVPLTDDERKTMGKMGDKTVAFVQKIGGYMQSNPNFIPSYLDHDEVSIDIKNALNLEPLEKLAEQVLNSISDTSMVSGSEAFRGALMYYNNVRQANKDGAPHARQIYDDLAQRFPGRNKKKSQPATAAESA